MQNKEFSALPRFLNFLVKALLLPCPEHFRLPRRKVRLHRKIRARQVQRLFVILTHDERATLTSVNRRSNAVTTTRWQQPSKSHRKRVGNEASLLPFVAGERADRGAGTGVAAGVGDF